ncbi:MAG TPA: class I SAM-dependent methyltransferase [Solirubrobacteraceae bacterium]|jgi:SAM-dependent methyltransferase
MASSYAQQIPVVIWVLSQLRPRTVLDVGKGFGKYAFLAHEYLGIPRDEGTDPTRSMAAQSEIAFDCVDIQPAYMWPHISQLYRNSRVGDITEIYRELSGYDVVLMTDVIEHLEKEKAQAVVRHFLDNGSVLLVTTPKRFFTQDIFQSDWEQHRSHWKPADFATFGGFMDWQTVGPGRVYVLARAHEPILGFGHRPMQRARRLARLVRSEF